MPIEFTQSGITFKEAANATSAANGSSKGRSWRFICESNDPDACAAAYVARLVSLGDDPGAYAIAADLLSERFCLLSADYTQRKTRYVSFSTTGGTTHLNQSYGTRARYGSGAPDYQGAIGVDGSTVNGVDVTVPAFNFAIRQRFAYVDDAYLATIAGLTGTVNAAAWGPFAGGEVLFLGADGGDDDQDYVEIAYQFSVRGNRTGLTFGPISGVAKFGWDYVWVKHREKLVGDAILVEPSAVYVEQVYPAGNFTLLGLF
jgi:hypothetical protein